MALEQQLIMPLLVEEKNVEQNENGFQREILNVKIQCVFVKAPRCRALAKAFY